METKAKLKKEMRLKRQLELEKKRRNTRILVWSLSAGIVILIVLLAIFWPKPAPFAFQYDKIPTMGAADAKVKLVEFGDFKCPTCKYFSEEITSKLKTEYIDTGKASLSYQNWTIIYDDSYTAALAGLAIYHQNNEEFWKFYDALYANQQAAEKQIWATPEFLVDLAKQEGLAIDYDKLKQDIEQQTYADELDKQNAFARKNQFSGTPTLLINGEKYTGALNYESIKAAIDKALQQSE